MEKFHATAVCRQNPPGTLAECRGRMSTKPVPSDWDSAHCEEWPRLIKLETTTTTFEVPESTEPVERARMPRQAV